jgi:hypothetical protein
VTELVPLNASVPIPVGKAMRENRPKSPGDLPMEGELYANICKAGKRALLGVLVGLVGCLWASSLYYYFLNFLWYWGLNLWLMQSKHSSI